MASVFRPALFLLPGIAPPLEHVFNLSLTTGYFPDLLKYAVITPIKKKPGAPTLENFRPIALLPNFSKILEKVILNRLLPFFQKHKIINKEQFGFIQNLSTTDAICHLTEHIYENLDKRFWSTALFCDLAKAFELMVRAILFMKLEKYGIRGPALELIKSCFKNRKILPGN